MVTTTDRSQPSVEQKAFRLGVVCQLEGLSHLANQPSGATSWSPNLPWGLHCRAGIDNGLMGIRVTMELQHNTSEHREFTHVSQRAVLVFRCVSGPQIMHRGSQGVRSALDIIHKGKETHAQS